MTKFIEKMKVNNVVTGWVDDHAEELIDWSTNCNVGEREACHRDFR